LAALLAMHANPSARTYLTRLVGRVTQTSSSSSGVNQIRNMPIRPIRLGINLAQVRYYSGERAFANLAMGSRWQMLAPPRPIDVAALQRQEAALVGSNGELRAAPSGGMARILTPPNGLGQSVTIHCSYQGTGDVGVDSPTRSIAQVSGGKGAIGFTWQQSKGIVRIIVRSVASPIVGLDCRETSLAPSVRFAPAFVASLKPFRVVRFMDWENTNANAAIDWSNRHTASSIDVFDGGGVAIEDIVALSNAARVDPWVTVPWNAGDDYVRRFAQMMHDGIPGDRPVYVEVANEVWNWGFPVTRQASEEGLKAGLSTSGDDAFMLRYAQRTVEVMKIWTQVFRDRPSGLVRVIASQNVLPQRARKLLQAPELADNIDAVASAPYFGLNPKNGPPKDVDGAFAELDVALGQALDYARQYRAIAASYGKRYIAYEAGQHVVIPDNVKLLEAIQRDDRMYSLYKRYLNSWRNNIGDTLTFYDSTAPINKFGAWGLVEYAGQPLSNAPKMRAVIEESNRR